MARVAAGIDVGETAAGDRLRGTRPAEHEAVAGSRRDRLGEVELDPAPAAGRDLVGVEQDRSRRDLGRPGVEHERRAVTQRAARGRQDHHLGVDPARLGQGAGADQHVAAAQVVLLHPDQVCRHPSAGRGELEPAVVLLEPADPHPSPAGDQLQLLADGQGAVDQGAGDD